MSFFYDKNLNSFITSNHDLNTVKIIEGSVLKIYHMINSSSPKDIKGPVMNYRVQFITDSSSVSNQKKFLVYIIDNVEIVQLNNNYVKIIAKEVYDKQLLSIKTYNNYISIELNCNTRQLIIYFDCMLFYIKSLPQYNTTLKNINKTHHFWSCLCIIMIIFCIFASLLYWWFPQFFYSGLQINTIIQEPLLKEQTFKK